MTEHRITIKTDDWERVVSLLDSAMDAEIIESWDLTPADVRSPSGATTAGDPGLSGPRSVAHPPEVECVDCNKTFSVAVVVITQKPDGTIIYQCSTDYDRMIQYAFEGMRAEREKTRDESLVTK